MHIALLWRYFIGRGGLLQMSTLFSALGVALGVFCLVVSMSSFSGFESSLRRAITDSQGHIMVLSRGMPMEHPTQVENQLWSVSPDVESVLGYAILEGMVAHSGQVGFVFLTGLPWPGFESVLNLEGRMVAGSLAPEDPGSERALLGKGVAKKFGLNIGDAFPFVWPRATGRDGTQFSPLLKNLKVSAIVDLGKHDLNERTVIVPREVVQDLGQMGDRISGFYVNLSDPELAPRMATEISARLGPNFWVSDWRAQNRNLFSAIELEKLVIFFVLLIMVVAASVNVSANLSTMVLKKYADIALLKTLGLGDRSVQMIFVGYGLLVCTFGLALGLSLGATGVWVLEWAQARWSILPGDVYKLDTIELEIRALDLLWIIVATYVIGTVSTWLPARRGARLQPVEGLRYE